MDRGPSHAARRKPDTLRKRLPLICFNVAMVSVLLPGSVWMLDDRFPVTVPSPGVFLAQLAIVFVVDDFGFYWVHRALHHYRWLYRRVHRYHHEAVAPFPIEFIYVHPLEVLMVGTGTALGLVLALLPFGQISAWTLWVAVTVRITHELDIHSGLRSILGKYIPFFGSAEHHARHHAGGARCNYASTFTLWDRLFGTESNPYGEAVAARAPR